METEEEKETQTQCPICNGTLGIDDPDYEFNGKNHCGCECWQIAQVLYVCKEVKKCRRCTPYHQALRLFAGMVEGLFDGSEPEAIINELFFSQKWHTTRIGGMCSPAKPPRKELK